MPNHDEGRKSGELLSNEALRAKLQELKTRVDSLRDRVDKLEEKKRDQSTSGRK